MENKSKEINGVTYLVTPFGVKRALILKAKLAKILLPVLGEALGESGLKAKDVLDMNIDLSGAIDKLFQNIDEFKFLSLCEEILSKTVALKAVKGEQRKFFLGAVEKEIQETAWNEVFGGDIMSIYQVLMFVLEVNYPNLLKKVTSGFGNLQKTEISFQEEEKGKEE